MKKDIFKKAHELTKKIIKTGDNYRATFKLCLSFVYSQLKKGVVKMIKKIRETFQVKTKGGNDLEVSVFEVENGVLLIQKIILDNKIIFDRDEKETNTYIPYLDIAMHPVAGEVLFANLKGELVDKVKKVMGVTFDSETMKLVIDSLKLKELFKTLPSTRKKEKEDNANKIFNENNSIKISFRINTSYGVSILSEDIKDSSIALNMAKAINCYLNHTDLLNKYKTSTDFGDYTITDFYSCSKDEFLQLYQSALSKKDEIKLAKETAKQNKIKELTKLAKQTGEKQEYYSISVPCNDPSEACNVDVIVTYITPEGEMVEERQHTW